MLTVPEGYREAMAAGNPIHIKMEFTDGTIITDADIDESAGVTLTDAFNPDTDIKMGKASCRQLQARIIVNDNTRYAHWASDFALSFGVEDGAGGVIWVPFGTFTGQRPKNTTTLNAIDYTAYDQIRLLDACADDYLDTTTFNKYVSVMLDDIAEETGLTISGTSDCIYAAMQRNMGNRFTGTTYTFRQLLEACAETCGVYAKIGGPNMDECRLKFFNIPGGTNLGNSRLVTRDEIFYEEHADLYTGLRWNQVDELTWDELETMTWKEISGYYKDANAFDGVYAPKNAGGVIGRYPKNVKTGHIYSFAGNPVMRLTNTTSHVTTYLQPIYERLAMLGGSLPMKVECLGDLVTEAGDVINVELPEDTVEMPIFVKTMHWNGMLIDTYETTAPDA